MTQGITIKVTLKENLIIETTKPVKLKVYGHWYEIKDVMEVARNE
jgi:hypothetical protein